jgi:hypothetical protein
MLLVICNHGSAMGKFYTYLRHRWHHENEDDVEQLEWLLKLENPSTHIFVKALGLGPSNQHFGHGWKHDLIIKSLYMYLQKQTSFDLHNITNFQTWFSRTYDPKRNDDF